jgi:hypothetical protein
MSSYRAFFLRLYRYRSPHALHNLMSVESLVSRSISLTRGRVHTRKQQATWRV